MNDPERLFHEHWLGLMQQQTEGLVVSVPVLVDAQCMEKQPLAVQQRWRHFVSDGEFRLLPFLTELLGYRERMFDQGATLPEDLALYVPEGGQTIRPTLALRKEEAPDSQQSPASTPAAIAGDRYHLLLWEIPIGLDLDAPEVVTGAWHYPPAAKFDRLLRHTRVPLGLLTNGAAVRLIYAPHGEASGSMTFRLDDLGTVSGRPMLDAFIMLLSAHRLLGVATARALPALLAESRRRQANVTNDLADQVLEALEILLRGFDEAAARDQNALPDERSSPPEGSVVHGLRTVLLRLVLLLYAEDRGMFPVHHPLYAQHYAVLGLFDQLREDASAYPDSMNRRFGAWGRLLAVFRAAYFGVRHGDFSVPARRGTLFNPQTFPFLEGWDPEGTAPVHEAAAQAEVPVPSVSDETIFRVLEKLLFLEGQRLSYRSLDVEQIGAVYENLMGYHAVRLAADAVCLRPDRVWVTAEEIREVPAAQRTRWLKDNVGLAPAQGAKLAAELERASTEEAQRNVLVAYAAGGRRADRSRVYGGAGQLVLQPGPERRRTSSHYTPPSLTKPIVARTLQPLLDVMGPAPSAERLLTLKVCDPAMGSGAFLVEACRYLADAVVAAWTRENELATVAATHGDPVLHARRLVAQRCLYGVDKNAAAVELAKLSLWLVTMGKDQPFSFLDHALRHGDSLVGLSFAQIRRFAWSSSAREGSGPGLLSPPAPRSSGTAPAQLDLFAAVGVDFDNVLQEAVTARLQILALASCPETPDAEKQRLLADAEDAMDRARLLADLVVGAFFAHDKDKDRKLELGRRLRLVQRWLAVDDAPVPEELRAMQQALRAQVPTFHWDLEFPEVFYLGRPDPLDDNRCNQAACMDAFVGNPPFSGKNGIIENGGPSYLPWLQTSHVGAHGNADLSAHFFRRVASLLGDHGTVGLIATNTIAQGDTRATGLQPLVAAGFRIYVARESLTWPNHAAVTVSIVHLAKGSPLRVLKQRRLNSIPVPAITSRLRAETEQSEQNESDAIKLSENSGLSFQGSIVLGMGFTLTPDEREQLMRKNPKNAERIFPYLGGEEVNTSPTQAFDRYVISFGQMSLEEAGKWPDLLAIVREKVKPERDQLKDNTDGLHRKKHWWQFGRWTPALYAAIAPLQRCLVTSQVSKHLIFSFQPTDRVFSHRLYAFPFDGFGAFAILQSRIHEPWARFLSSTLETRMNYAASDCFETFPFPPPDPRTVRPELEAIGQELYEARSRYMAAQQVGLTVSYNRLKDPGCDEADIRRLRSLHETLDQAVLRAYGWGAVAVPPYCIRDEADRDRLRAFEAEVLERLATLNGTRAMAERLLGTKAVGKTTKGKRRGSAAQQGIEFPPPPRLPSANPPPASRKVVAARAEPAPRSPSQRPSRVPEAVE